MASAVPCRGHVQFVMQSHDFLAAASPHRRGSQAAAVNLAAADFDDLDGIGFVGHIVWVGEKGGCGDWLRHCETRRGKAISGSRESDV